MYCKFVDVVIIHNTGTNRNPDSGKLEVIIAIEKAGFYSLRSDELTWEALSLIDCGRSILRV